MKKLYILFLLVSPLYCFGQDSVFGQHEIQNEKIVDLNNVNWIAQNAQHADFEFKVSCSAYEDSDRNDSFTNGIAIYRKGHKEIYQLITGHDGDSNKSCDNQISVLDANFDGYLDISLPNQNGGAGPNSTEYFFIFDAKTKKFKFNQKLSDLTAPSFNHKHKEVTSSWRSSCCVHGSETYSFMSGKMVLVKTWSDYWTVDDSGYEKVEIETGHLVNGKMRFKNVIKIIKSTESK